MLVYCCVFIYKLFNWQRHILVITFRNQLYLIIFAAWLTSYCKWFSYHATTTRTRRLLCVKRIFFTHWIIWLLHTIKLVSFGLSECVSYKKTCNNFFFVLLLIICYKWFWYLLIEDTERRLATASRANFHLTVYYRHTDIRQDCCIQQ